MSQSDDPMKPSFQKQASISSFEQGLNIVSPPPAVAPITIYPGPSKKLANLSKVSWYF